jgi:AraC-like DNA-binding protein
MTKCDIVVAKDQDYYIGYSVVKKEKCEIPNFVSPTFRLVHFLSGSALWKIGGETYTFNPDDIVIFNNLIKRNIQKVLSNNIVYEYFDFYPFLIMNDTLRNFFYSKVYKVTSKSDQSSDKIYFLFENLKEEVKKTDDPFQIFSIQHTLDLLVLEFYRKNSGEDLLVNSSLSNIMKAMQYLQYHFSDCKSVKELAGVCGYSPEYFSRTFKKYIGLSPVNYLINLRLENALRLVETQNITILDAAFQSGFHSSSAFYKIFNVYKSKSPLRYMKQNS